MARAAFISIIVLAIISGCERASSEKVQSRIDEGCQIVKVVDGDTVKAECPNGARGNLRLMGFDTPETRRPGCSLEKRLGLLAQSHLETVLIGARSIVPQTHGRDKYNRVLTQLYVDGTDIADIMVGAGLAVYYAGGKRINWCDKLATL